MSSIFVDTIRKIGGTLGTDIRVNTASVYESENSTGTTQNLVQSLTKAWVNHDQATVNDSFNVGSVTDNGTGDSGHNFTNNMANIHYVGSGMGVHDSGSYSTFMSYDHDDPFTTAQATVNQQLVNQNLHDAEPVNTMYAGDLA
mgnify:FL=1